MFNILGIIASGIYSVFKVLKHPLVSVIAFLPFAVLLIKNAINFLADMTSQYIVGNSLTSIPACLGVFDALSLYVSIIVAGWGVKRVVHLVLCNL